jgi:hypothetical protein
LSYTDVVNLVGRIYDNNRKFGSAKLGEISIALDDLGVWKDRDFFLTAAVNAKRSL